MVTARTKIVRIHFYQFPDSHGIAVLFPVQEQAIITMDLQDSKYKGASDLTWSFSSLGCPELNLAQIFQLAQRFNIRQVELRCVEGRMDLPLLFADRYGNPGKLREWLAGESVVIAALDSSGLAIGGDKANREQFLEFAACAHDLNIPSVRVFDGGTSQAKMDPFQRDEMVEFLGWWEERRAQEGWNVRVIIETHDALNGAEAILSVREAFRGELNILWDSHHTWRKGGEDPLVTWEAIRPLVRHIHFKDSSSRPDGNWAYSYTVPGEGDFPLGRLFSRLREDGFVGPLSLEWEKYWRPHLASLETILPTLAPFRS